MTPINGFFFYIPAVRVRQQDNTPSFLRFFFNYFDQFQNWIRRCFRRQHQLYIPPQLFIRVLQTNIPTPDVIINQTNESSQTCQNCINKKDFDIPTDCEVCYSNRNQVYLLKLHPCHHYLCIDCIKNSQTPVCPFCKTTIELNTRNKYTYDQDSLNHMNQYEACLHEKNILEDHIYNYLHTILCIKHHLYYYHAHT